MGRYVVAVALIVTVLAGGSLAPIGGASVLAQDGPRRAAQMNFFANTTDGRLGSLYLLQGAGRHSLLVAAEDEAILVDTKPEPQWGQPMLGKIQNVTDQPVATIINTNARNAASNPEFPTAVEIIAHEHTKARMARMDAFQGANARFLPNKTFTDRLSFPVETVGENAGTNRVDLYHFGPGHTDGDIVVVFPQFGVAFLGDLFPDKATPAVDVANGGSAVSFPETLAKAAAAIHQTPRISIVVPGRAAAPSGQIIIQSWMTVADLDEYVEFNRAFLAAVKDAIKSGKSAEEAAAGLKLPEKFKDYGMRYARDNVEAIYSELTK